MRGGIFPPARPAVLGKAQVLEIGEGDAGHQRVSVQPGPGTPLEVVQPQLLLELLVRLLAHPARLDRRGERAQGRARIQVAEVVFALT
jgi:hypothetical protein